MDTLNNENEPKTFYGVFNKHTRVLYAFETDKVIAENYDTKNFLIKEIILQPFEYFFGDYDTGQIYHEAVKPLVREDDLEVKFNREIAQEYSVFKQLCVIAEVLDKNKDLIKTNEFNELAKFLKGKKIRYEHGLKAMKENKETFNFVSKQDLIDFEKKRVLGIT